MGPAGNRTQIDEADGTARAYGSDNLYRLTLETVTDALSTLVYEKSFVYDDVGNRETQTTTGLGAGTIGYTYDTRDRLLNENGTTFGYDDNGNLMSKAGEATYTWDFEDRLIRVDKIDGTVVDHGYDTDGVRVRTTTTPSGQPSVITDFLVDTSGSLSHVVAESEVGVFRAYYVRGDDLLSVIRPTEQRYVHADGLGSVRVLTDEVGAVTDTYTYTAFGEEFGRVGTDVQPYQFAGEPFDPNVGFYYNRARWLDVGSGRFLGMDPATPSASDPLSLHKYSYAESNPANRLDPTGLFGVATVFAGLGMLTTIAARPSTPFLQAALSAAKIFRLIPVPVIEQGASRGDPMPDNISASGLASPFPGWRFHEIREQMTRAVSVWNGHGVNISGIASLPPVSVSHNETSLLAIGGKVPLTEIGKVKSILGKAMGRQSWPRHWIGCNSHTDTAGSLPTAYRHDIVESRNLRLVGMCEQGPGSLEAIALHESSEG